MENKTQQCDFPSGYIKSLVEQFRSSDTLPPGVSKEDVLFVEMDRLEWYRLEGELNLRDEYVMDVEKFPKFFYNPITSRLSVEWQQMPLQGRAVELFRNQLSDATDHICPLALRTNEVCSQYMPGDKMSTTKTPKLALKSDRKALIIEIGVSHTYDELIDIARFWLEGSKDVPRVILMKITEPKFRCPIENPSISMLESLGLPTSVRYIKKEFHLENPLGPVKLGTTEWVAKSDVFLEIWKLNTKTGRAEKHGSRIEMREALPYVLPLRLSDFLDVESHVDRDIVIDWKRFHQKQESDLVETAVLRYEEMLEWCRQREEDA